MEHMETKNSGIKILHMLMLFGMVPLVTAIILLSVFATFAVSDEMETEIREKLALANKEFNEYVSDWYKEEGEEAFTKENKEYTYVDAYQEEKIEFTIFLGKTRALTSIKDASGNRIEGTDASEAVVSTVLNQGQEYKAQGVEINGEKYFVDYLPMKDADGNIVGMTFVGQTEEDVHDAIATVVGGFLIVAFILIVIFAVIIILISFRIRKTIEDMSSYLREMADGDITSQLVTSTNVREFNSMIDSIHHMQGLLGKVISDVKSTTEHVASEVQEVSRLSDTSAESAEQISQAVNELATTAQSMAENVQDVNAQAIEMDEKVSQISANVESLAQNSEDMLKVSREASTSMEQMLASSRQSVQSVESIDKQIRVTNDSVKRINEAIDLIIDVASQTKLLSLNASIEAARAGEAGKGFAVVADSISQLSEQSNESAATIRTIAEDILRNSDDSVRLAGEIRETIAEEQKSIQNTQSSFTSLDDAINVSVTKIQNIDGMTGELRKIKEVIVGNISDLSAISEENAASNEEVTASVDSIATGLDQIAAEISDVYQKAKGLKEEVEYFR